MYKDSHAPKVSTNCNSCTLNCMVIERPPEVDFLGVRLQTHTTPKFQSRGRKKGICGHSSLKNMPWFISVASSVRNKVIKL